MAALAAMNRVDAVQALVQRKREAGEVESVTPVEEASRAETPSNVVDLTELLARSLSQRKAGAGEGSGKRAPARRAPAKSSARRRA